MELKRGTKRTVVELREPRLATAAMRFLSEMRKVGLAAVLVGAAPQELPPILDDAIAISDLGPATGAPQGQFGSPSEAQRADLEERGTSTAADPTTITGAPADRSGEDQRFDVPETRTRTVAARVAASLAERLESSARKSRVTASRVIESCLEACLPRILDGSMTVEPRQDPVKITVTLTLRDGGPELTEVTIAAQDDPPRKRQG